MEQWLEQYRIFAVEWVQTNVLTTFTAAQWACILGALILAAIVVSVIRPRFETWVQTSVENELLRSAFLASTGIGYSIVFFVLAQICIATFVLRDHFPHWLFAASDLAFAWIVIRLISFIIPNRAIAKTAAVFIWGITLLQIVGVMVHIKAYLQGLSIAMGDAHITVYGAIKGIVMAALCLQVASLISRFTVKKIETTGSLSPTLQVLISKIVNILLYTAAILLALTSVGIDLTSLTIFSGAIGVGIGFGLKTIFSNYVSGILLLIDNSIKPGDTIEIGGVLGTVQDMRGRYASLLTRDGKEYLVPNEQLIANEVVNWTHSDRIVRLIVPVSIAYGTNTRQAKVLLEKASENVTRVLKFPAPVARIVELGDNAINMELWIWIADAEVGVRNVKSDVYFEICDIFEEHGISFPFPQRDIHIKQASALQVEVKGQGRRAADKK
ncbi:mechanosensitive ion channel domain-containing protein [Pseudodesulfovibrio sp. zrk46]|uniref:mechanosensitive ion channel family protein n=1 Tax=Pseudodesulfovibrio sp. zrk46 TaxID=2725288 RepID=UPI0014499973|nr:mechanosensitive ion channel domain-containing protein [Pseudodesulfovibrio sp. zrk46]QJB57056.1 mechanosensitive ion channel [Pseudodesulfovibrio sp. zrk46]